MAEQKKVLPEDPQTLPPESKQNQILGALPREDYERLLPHLELVQMPLGWTVSESDDHVDYVHILLPALFR